MNRSVRETVWERGRLDGRSGTGRVLFGRMYEDSAIELEAFAGRGRIFCIASAGCTAMALAPYHDVVAVDVNPVQLAYAQRRLAGDAGEAGEAERFLGVGRLFGPIVGWWPATVQAFLELENPVQQLAYWREHLDTLRFRTAVDGLLSISALRAVYASALLQCLPAHLGRVMRMRLERCVARHANAGNPYLRALLWGEMPAVEPPADTRRVDFVRADAADFLEAQAAGSFEGFSLSNILDGADAHYRTRLCAAVRRAASVGAVVIERSFGEPPAGIPTNRAADDRAALWGIVDVRPADA